jgi:hypothetical protein
MSASNIGTGELSAAVPLLIPLTAAPLTPAAAGVTSVIVISPDDPVELFSPTETLEPQRVVDKQRFVEPNRDVERNRSRRQTTFILESKADTPVDDRNVILPINSLIKFLESNFVCKRCHKSLTRRRADDEPP